MLSNRGTDVERAAESLRRAEDALDRARGTLTEDDWRAQVERATGRLLALTEARREGADD